MQIRKPPSLDELLSHLGTDSLMRLAVEAQGVAGAGPYYHWDKLRHLKPPGDLSHEEWWIAIKFGRIALRRRIPLSAATGEPFTYAMPDELLRRLHYVDQHLSGEIAMEEVVTADEQARQRYVVNSLMEEAIRSSQLEGAATTRRVAKELLRTGRPPKDRSEHMILNNYRAIRFMREEIGDRLTPEVVLELNAILTEGTLDDPGAAGRLQIAGEERVGVYDSTDGTLIHQPPPAEELPARLAVLCDFANDTSDETFMHPVVRAILLHFGLAYDHPFLDGNGRTARALFYWRMRTSGYWLTEYLSISTILRQAPAQYTKAFLMTETDEGDATYFILYQLDVIERATKELHTYLRKKVREVREVEELVRGSAHFNHRQLALLSNAIRNADQTYSFRSHSRSHNVTHETARHDLLHLAQRGLLERRKSGRQYVFYPSRDISGKLRELSISLTDATGS